MVIWSSKQHDCSWMIVLMAHLYQFMAGIETNCKFAVTHPEDIFSPCFSKSPIQCFAVAMIQKKTHIKTFFKCDSTDLQELLRCWPWPPSTLTCERRSPRFPTWRPLTCTWWAALCSSSWPCWSTLSSTTSSLARAPSDRRRRLRKQPRPTTRSWDLTPIRFVWIGTFPKCLCAVFWYVCLFLCEQRTSSSSSCSSLKANVML